MQVDKKFDTFQILFFKYNSWKLLFREIMEDFQSLYTSIVPSFLDKTSDENEYANNNHLGISKWLGKANPGMRRKSRKTENLFGQKHIIKWF